MARPLALGLLLLTLVGLPLGRAEGMPGRAIPVVELADHPDSLSHAVSLARGPAPAVERPLRKPVNWPLVLAISLTIISAAAFVAGLSFAILVFGTIETLGPVGGLAVVLGLGCIAVAASAVSSFLDGIRLWRRHKRT